MTTRTPTQVKPTYSAPLQTGLLQTKHSQHNENGELKPQTAKQTGNSPDPSIAGVVLNSFDLLNQTVDRAFSESRFGHDFSKTPVLNSVTTNEVGLTNERSSRNHSVNAPSTCLSGILQRKCACGNTAGASGTCSDCQKKREKSLTGIIQTKLTINQPGDRYEQEADRIAEQVLAASSSDVNAAPIRIQRYSGQSSDGPNTAPASVDQVMSSPGSPLEPSLQQDMEQRFGHDFSRVRVHTDSAAAESAQDINANAYTVANNIVFGFGRYEPRTHEGRRLIAHELTHVLQQSDRDQNISWGILNRDEGRNNGCRKETETPCPGQKGQFTQIDSAPEMFLVNRGTCTLFVASLGDDGSPLQDRHLELSRGGASTFFPDIGSTGVVFGCLTSCKGLGKLEHPFDCA